MTINALWHAANPMPPNATLNQQIAWHLKHARVCGCRPMPERIKAEIARRSGQQGLPEMPPETLSSSEK